MKYFLSIVFGSVAVCLTLILGWSVYNGFTQDWTWWLVSLGILGPAVVSVLITSAAISASRDF